MKKVLLSAGLLVGFTATAQQDEHRGRMGINTTTPKASLDITRHTGIPETSAQGLLLPRLTQEQRNKMTQSTLVVGLQIFNTDKNCIDWWNGKNWQCTDGSIQDSHGATASYIEEAEHTETRNFYKNNCPSGQQATGMISFTGTGRGRGISPISLQDAKNKALEAAKLNYNRLGQDHANATGDCENAPSVPAVDPISIVDPSLKIGNTKYWFSSIYDKDYLAANGDVIMPTTPASWSDQSPSGDGAEEAKVLDVQGIIPVLNSQKTNAIDIAIPIITPPSASVVLPGFTSYLEIPAEYTQDGRKGIVVFTWEPTTLSTSTKYFKANIYAKGSDINLKKLDLMKGLGSDHLGLSLGVIKYPINASDNDPSTWKGELDVRLISAIPDKRFNVETTIAMDTQKRHQFLYVPAMGADGKVWLGNNLGANYANIHHAQFNPGQQAKTYNDFHAYGSLFQWGKPADGHELMTWASASSGSPTFTQSPYNWSSDISSSLTQFTDNCPSGWHTPTQAELNALNTGINYSTVNIQNKGHFAGGLRVALAGYRYHTSGSSLNSVGSNTHWWSSTPHSSTHAYNLYLDTGSASVDSYSSRSFGFGVRCLKDS